MRIINRPFLLCAALCSSFVLNADDAPPETVAHVDLGRYAGLWFEISKIPNRFQTHCMKDTTAEYRLRGDERIDVVNSCVTDSGKLDTAEGIARVVDGKTNAKLEVSFVDFFGWHLFWGDYWVLDLGEDYAYAVVGTPSRRFGWVLSRTATLSEGDSRQVDEALRRNGYNPDDFQASPQTPSSAEPRR